MAINNKILETVGSYFANRIKEGIASVLKGEKALPVKIEFHRASGYGVIKISDKKSEDSIVDGFLISKKKPRHSDSDHVHVILLADQDPVPARLLLGAASASIDDGVYILNVGDSSSVSFVKRILKFCDDLVSNLLEKIFEDIVDYAEAKVG